MKRINLTDSKGCRVANWFDSDKAEYFKEDTWHDGRNWISHATGDQFIHEGLFITGKKRFILNRWSQWQGSSETYLEVTKEQAVQWLIRNNHYQEVEQAYADLLAIYEV